MDVASTPVPALRAVFLTQEAIPHLLSNSFHVKSPCEALKHESQNMNPERLFLKIIRSFQCMSVAFYTNSKSKCIHLCWPHFLLFWLLAPWISFSHLLLHLFVLFRNKVPAQSGSGSGGRRRERARTVRAQEERERSNFKHPLKASAVSSMERMRLCY